MSSDKIQKKENLDIAKMLAELNKSRAKTVTRLENATGEVIESAPYRGMVYLLIDCSGSMAGQKLEQAKQGSIGFARDARKKGYRIGLISFSSYAEHVLSPTNDFIEFCTCVETLQISGSTNMADGIYKAIVNLNKGIGEKVICIVTDGQPDSPVHAVEQANSAKSLSIDIMTIGTDDADIEFLKTLATRSELSVKVERLQLSQGITNMARLLPGARHSTGEIE